MAAGEPAKYGPYSASYVSAYDGDTMTLDIRLWPGLTKRAQGRLRGVDTPEMRGGCAAERRRARDARDFTRRWLQGRDIRVAVYGVGKYGRPLLSFEGDLAGALVERGLARWYDGGSRPPWCPPNANL